MPRRVAAALALATIAVIAGCSTTVSPNPSPAGSPSGAPSAAPSVEPSTEPSTSPPDPSPTEPSGGPAIGDPAGVAIDLELVVDGLDAPLYATSAGDGSGRLFVVEQEGVIRIVRDGRLVPEPFLDISDRVQAGGERGLLGLAFPPGFGDVTNAFWVHYSNLSGDTTIAGFTVSETSPDVADPASEWITFEVGQPYANHNGGWIGFGPDGMLYIALGDGGSGGDPHRYGQNLRTALGKLLRIQVGASLGGHGEHVIPADNPFTVDPEHEARIWSYGLRNPWRTSFDRVTGDLWIGDVGQNAWEEIDRGLVAEGAGKGANYGWNTMEASACFEPRRGCDESGLVAPIAEYSHDEGCTVVGGYVYRGSAYPALTGVYLFGDYCSGRIWGLASGGPARQDPVRLLDTPHTISSFGEDEQGELYLTDLASGELYRIVATPR
jgi:glucose/arabinose dehydrogenase